MPTAKTVTAALYNRGESPVPPPRQPRRRPYSARCRPLTRPSLPPRQPSPPYAIEERAYQPPADSPTARKPLITSCPCDLMSLPTQTIFHSKQ
jgi:hypothetical protein